MPADTEGRLGVGVEVGRWSRLSADRVMSKSVFPAKTESSLYGNAEFLHLPEWHDCRLNPG